MVIGFNWLIERELTGLRGKSQQRCDGQKKPKVATQHFRSRWMNDVRMTGSQDNRQPLL